MAQLIAIVCFAISYLSLGEWRLEPAIIIHHARYYLAVAEIRRNLIEQDKTLARYEVLLNEMKLKTLTLEERSLAITVQVRKQMEASGDERLVDAIVELKRQEAESRKRIDALREELTKPKK